jgi:hypothetical protein
MELNKAETKKPRTAALGFSYGISTMDTSGQKVLALSHGNTAEPSASSFLMHM